MHEKSAAFLRGNIAPLMTTLAAITETLYVLDPSLAAQKDCLEFFGRGAVGIVPIDNDDMGRIRDLMQKYGDLPMDFADATIVLACEKLATDRVVSSDSDFSIYRLSRNKTIVNELL